MATETTILVVDDEKEIADLVEIYLVSDGYRVVKANDAEEGLRLLEENDAQLVLLDIMMPGMDGLSMCAKIRETRNIPIIMLSAKSAERRGGRGGKEEGGDFGARAGHQPRQPQGLRGRQGDTPHADRI